MMGTSSPAVRREGEQVPYRTRQVDTAAASAVAVHEVVPTRARSGVLKSWDSRTPSFSGDVDQPIALDRSVELGRSLGLDDEHTYCFASISPIGR